MSGNKKMDVLISMKAEIQAQKEGQEKIQKLCFENINIGQFTNETIKLLAKYNDLSKNDEQRKYVWNSMIANCHLQIIQQDSQIQQNYDYAIIIWIRIVSNILFSIFPKVTYLDISGNKKISQDDLKVLVELKELQHLVFNEKDTDRALLFESIPQLSYIDHKDKAGNEVEDEENEDEEDEDDDDEDEEDEEEDLEDDEEEDDDEEDAEEAEESEEEQPVQKKKKQ
ncbi:unnamed protein product (macronuclear) [Paramecium tetraurelia]|uniref:Uncharacterized protein n=1 Tax=Paramecium tetraurelia TaxID=5888 RepID=A0EFE9_PARTE|nr:uncharacterized protein GSPATT00026363001 [Paramecium tetraurelia]CAK94040.1 unnamed protein product [Paramecium tetraurelia]|eukprot:XP_001461413.1 hypothetical protein (macronuclear) [Paramecium tetraurelia strain d4-2]